MAKHHALNNSSLPNVYWKAVWIAALAVALGVLVIHESLLIAAGHKTSLVSDADLWSLQRDRVSSLGENDFILLGASRMQTNIDLGTLEEMFPESTIVQLAQSGLGTSFPVFEDLVRNTDFCGTIILDETESTLIEEPLRQRETLNHYYKRWSVDRKLNKLLTCQVQNVARFANPSGSAYRLWGNLLFDRELPEANHVRSDFHRQDHTDFLMPGAKERVTRLRAEAGLNPAGTQRDNHFNDMHSQQFETSREEIVGKISKRWEQLVLQFKARGGTIVFIRMPESHVKADSSDSLWTGALESMGALTLYCPTYNDLNSFELPDTSHLDYRDSKEFTRRVAAYIREKLSPSYAKNGLPG